MIAREHGFPSWPRLRAYVERLAAHGPGLQHAYHEDLDYYDDRAYGLLASAEDGTDGRGRRLRAPRRAADPRRARGRSSRASTGSPRGRRCAATSPACARRGEPFARAYRAIEAHDVERLPALLDRFPELVAARGTNGNDLLGMAGATCDERLVAILLERGADVTRANAHGWTPLHQAAYSDLPALARMLLDAGAPVDVSARGDGGTPLVVALFWGNRDDRRAARRARRRSAQPARRGRARAARPARRADRRPRQARARGRRAPRLLPARTAASRPGSRPTTTREVRDEALTWAARNDRVEALELLVERGASVEADVYRGTALSWAAACGRVAAIRRLVALGADPTSAPRFGGPGHGEGTTALHLAAQNGDIDAIHALLELGADPTIRDGLYDGTPAELGRARRPCSGGRAPGVNQGSGRTRRLRPTTATVRRHDARWARAARTTV